MSPPSLSSISACATIQALAPSLVVKAFHTSLRGASMTMLLTTGSPAWTAEMHASNVTANPIRIMRISRQWFEVIVVFLRGIGQALQKNGGQKNVAGSAVQVVFLSSI